MIDCKQVIYWNQLLHKQWLTAFMAPSVVAKDKDKGVHMRLTSGQIATARCIVRSIADQSVRVTVSSFRQQADTYGGNLGLLPGASQRIRYLQNDTPVMALHKELHWKSDVSAGYQRNYRLYATHPEQTGSSRH